MNKVWEYKYYTILSTHPDSVVRELNELGAEGWEVWRMKKYKTNCPEGGYNQVGVYLKRYRKAKCCNNPGYEQVNN